MLHSVLQPAGHDYPRTLCAIACSVALLALASQSARADALNASSATDDAASAMGRVEVAAPRIGPLSARSVLSSVDILGTDLVRDQQAVNTWELFSRAPGVMLTQFRQGNESGKLSFRGFNGEGEVNAVKLLIDGIPSNDNAGGMPFLDMIFPLEIARIEVVRGTNDARYGVHNIAGNANIVTRSGGNYGDARITYGSFDTKEIQIAKGIEEGNWSQNYIVGHVASGGYRDHASFDKTTFGGKWFYTSDDASYRFGLIARHAESNADEAGYLLAADARNHPTMSYPYAQSEGGNRQMNQVSVHLDGELGAGVSGAAKAYVNTVQDQRWLRYSSTTSQQERIIDENHYGALATLTYRPGQARPGQEWMKHLVIEGGLNVERQDDQSPRYSTTNQVRVATTRDHHFTYDTVGAYLQAVIKPLDSLTIIPAYRVDHVSGSFSDPSKNVHYEMNDYGLIKQPKLSIVYAPSNSASLYGNWGRTFQVGVGAAAYPATASSLRPSINEGWEAGVKFTPALWIDGRVALWEQSASGEIKRRLNDPAGGSENVGQTRRQGIDIQVNLRPQQDSNLWLAYSRQRSRIVQPDPSAPATIGNEIDHVPGHVFSAGVDVQATPDLKLSAWSNGQSDYYLTTANVGQKFGAYVLFNLAARYQLTPSVNLELQAKNLANRQVEYVWINDQSRHAPGDGRAFYLSANLTF
jgi:iron complex outermembrane receptor protein